GKCRTPGTLMIPQPSERRFRGIASALAALLLLVAFSCHELWRDEGQAWLLARDASGFGALFTGEARAYEGHPFAWFWLLRAVSLVSGSYLALQGTSFLITVANALLLLRLPGLPRWSRGLLALSYFSVFEFGVLARSYGLALLLLLLALRANSSPRGSRPLAVAALAGLAVNTVLLAFPAAALVVGVTCLEPLKAFFSRGSAPGRGRAALTALAAGAIFALAVLLAQVTTPVPSDAVAQLAPWPPLDVALLRVLGERLLTAFCPIPALGSGDAWWNSNVFVAMPAETPRLPAAGILPALVGLAWLTAWVWVLRRQPALAAGLAATALFVLLVAVRLPFRAIRYEGHVMLCVIVAVGLACALRPSLAEERPFAWLMALTFGASAVGTASALGHDALYPFSESHDAARLLADSQHAGAPLIGLEYYRMASLATYLNRPLYSAEHGRPLSYGIWATTWHHPGYFSASREVVLRGVCYAARAARPGRPAYLVNSGELRFDPQFAAEIRLEQAFVASRLESFRIYRVEPKGGGSPLLSLCGAAP
ncbi:MAG TPA: hypothetical protein VNG33_18855, partial [Polyangiaceae bacterium]|nr:hypothetical protein [Polyangiaceae bacterium]